MAGIPIYSPGTRLGDSRIASAGLPRTSSPLTAATQNPINQNLGVMDQIQQAPDWMQSMLNQRLLGQNKAGSYDHGLQLRDQYSNYLPQMNEFENTYGDAFYNPYFVQNAGEFGGQTGNRNFNPYASTLRDFSIGKNGDIFSDQRDPFTGAVMNSSLYRQYRDVLGSGAKNSSWGVTGYGGGGRDDFLANIAPYLNQGDDYGMVFDNYANKYSRRLY